MALSVKLTGYSRCPLCKQDVGHDKVTGEYIEPTSTHTLISHMIASHSRLGMHTYSQAKKFVDSLMAVTKVVATEQIQKNHYKIISLEHQVDNIKMETSNLQELVEMAEEPVEKVS